ncbi:MAG: amidase, partial [Alphaproteobacteria bacterium]|nr:amidase [Alphaproteobacteria bacterium]
MTKLIDMTLAQTLDGMEKKEFTSRELTESYLDAMDHGEALNAFVTKTREEAMEMASRADNARQKGEAGPLCGIPLAIKDLFCTAHVQTTASSRILEGFTPPYESTVTANLWRDGAVLLGKTALDEFAMGSSNETSYFGNVENPWRARDGKSRVPGGSSGGSAAAVAAHLAVAATGTDTGGSIRQPASFTGIVGLKPTYGRCSRWGIIAFASSLDQAGPMTRTVEDAAIMLNSMAGH